MSDQAGGESGPDDQEQPPTPVPPPPPGLPSAPPVSPNEAAPEAAPGWLGRSAPFVGIGTGVLLYALALGLSISGGIDDQGYWALGYLVFGLGITFVLLVVGTVLTVVQRTRGFGAGLLISVAIGVICGSGVCIALLRTA